MRSNNINYYCHIGGDLTNYVGKKRWIGSSKRLIGDHNIDLILENGQKWVEIDAV